MQIHLQSDSEWMLDQTTINLYKETYTNNFYVANKNRYLFLKLKL